MSISRRCPNCLEGLPIGSVRFDPEHSVFCPHCSKPILATSLAVEHKITPASPPTARSKNDYGVSTRHVTPATKPRIPARSSAAAPGGIGVSSRPRQVNGPLGDEEVEDHMGHVGY